MPDYEFNNWNYDPELNITFSPFNLKRQYNIGFYLDLYRGSKIFNDVYHEADRVGNQSFMKFGLILQPELYF